MPHRGPRVNGGERKAKALGGGYRLEIDYKLGLGDCGTQGGREDGNSCLAPDIDVRLVLERYSGHRVPNAHPSMVVTPTSYEFVYIGETIDVLFI
jgi:hypothetical protein